MSLWVVVLKQIEIEELLRVNLWYEIVSLSFILIVVAQRSSDVVLERYLSSYPGKTGGRTEGNASGSS